MIARLAVRFERAGLFFVDADEYLISDRLGYIQFVVTWMGGLRNAERGMRNDRILEFVQTVVEFFDAREKRSNVSALRFGFQDLRDLVREFFRVL